MSESLIISLNDILEITYEFVVIHGEIPFPEIGNFRLKVYPRQYNNHYYRFEPKKYQLISSKSIETSDKSLFEFVADKYKTDDLTIKSIWNNFILDFKKHLIQEKKKVWDTLGFFYLEKNKIHFQPNDPTPILNNFNLSFTPISIYGPPSKNSLSAIDQIEMRNSETDLKKEKPSLDNSSEALNLPKDPDKNPNPVESSTQVFNPSDKIETVLFFDNEDNPTPPLEIRKDTKTPSDKTTLEKKPDEKSPFSNLKFEPTVPKIEPDPTVANKPNLSQKQQETEIKDFSINTSEKETLHEPSENNPDQSKPSKVETTKTIKKYKRKIILYILVGLVFSYIIFHFFLYHYSLDTIYLE